MPKGLYVLYQPHGFLFTAPEKKYLIEGFCPWHTHMALDQEGEFGYCPICTEGMSARENERFNVDIMTRVGYRLISNKIEQICTVILKQ